MHAKAYCETRGTLCSAIKKYFNNPMAVFNPIKACKDIS